MDPTKLLFLILALGGLGQGGQIGVPSSQGPPSPTAGTPAQPVPALNVLALLLFASDDTNLLRRRERSRESSSGGGASGFARVWRERGERKDEGGGRLAGLEERVNDIAERLEQLSNTINERLPA